MAMGGIWTILDNRRGYFEPIKRLSKLASPLSVIASLSVLILLVACTSSPDPTPSPSAPASTAPTAVPELPVVAPAESSADRVVIEITDGSVARYLVQEQLANRNLPSDAIGETAEVSGTIVFNSAGKVQAANSKIFVNLKTLKSGEARRDNFIKENALESNSFPSAEIDVTSVTGLPWPLPESGEANFQIAGDMTVHGVTLPVTWESSAQFGSGELRGQSKTVVTFDQFGISKPSLFFILSLDDEIRLELDFLASVKSAS